MQDNKATARTADARGKSLAQSVYCQDASHLYQAAARDLMGRFLRAPFLDRRYVTAMELLHSLPYQRALVDEKGVYQTSVQNFALAQVKGTDISATQRIKELYGFVDDAARRLTAMEQAEPVAHLKRDDCLANIRKSLVHPQTSGRDFRINRLITAYLRNCRDWIEKLERLLDLFEAIERTDDAIPLCDKFLGDVLRSRSALDELLGNVRTLEDRLTDVVAVYQCDDDVVARSTSKPLMTRLLTIIRQHELKATRSPLIYHLYAGLKSRTDMASPDLLLEMQAIGRLREKLRIEDAYIGGIKTRKLLEQRIGRRVSAHSVGEHIKGVPLISEQIRTLLATYRLVPFADQRTPVLDRLALIFEDPMLADKLAKDAGKAIDHLTETGTLHRAINGSQLPDHLRRKYMDRLASVQLKFLRSTRFFVAMQQAIEQAPQRVEILLEACAQKAFIEEDMQKRAEDTLVNAASSAQFVQGYLARSRSPGERDKSLDDLRNKLREAGFDPASVLPQG